MNCKEIAEIKMRGAALYGDFELWTKTSTAIEKIDIAVVGTLNRKTLNTGEYHGDALDEETNLDGRPLWIMDADWRSFIERVMAERRSQVAALKPVANYAPPVGQNTRKPSKAEWAEIESCIRAYGSAHPDATFQPIWDHARASFPSLWVTRRPTERIVERLGLKKRAGNPTTHRK